MIEDNYTLPLAEMKNLSTVIADRLDAMIVGGMLRPGQHLVQMEVAERFGISRVAVRDALHLLRQRGLVVDVPRKGIIVRPISCKTVRDLFAVRRATEGLAARLACARATTQDLERLEQILQEQETLAAAPPIAELIEKDWEFHRTIYDLCDNEPLCEVIAGLWSRTRQARSLAQRDAAWGQGWAERSVARHRTIVGAFRDRDPGRAERLVVETISMAEEELVRGLEDAGWEENGEGT